MLSSKSFLFVVLTLCVSYAFTKTLSRRSKYLDQEQQKQLHELIAKKQRRSAAFPIYEDGNELSNSLTSEERGRDDNILKRNGFITIHNKPNYRHTVKRNGSLVLECDVSGQPPPSVYWLKNGEPATSQNLLDNEELTNRINQHSVVLNEGLASTRSRFFIDCADTADEAIYSCVAETEKDRTVSSTYVRVSGAGPDSDFCEGKCKSLISSYEDDVLSFPFQKKLVYQPPRIHMWSGTYVHESGKDARLLCRASGTDVKIRWYNEEGVAIEDGDKFEQLQLGDLIVRNLEWSDMGGYFCRASNSCGRDEQFTFLYPLAIES